MYVPSGKIPSSAETATSIPPALPEKSCAGMSDSFMNLAVNDVSSSISEGTRVSSVVTVFPPSSTHSVN